MTTRKNPLTAAAATLIAATLLATPAAAQLDDAAVSCRAAIAKNWSKLLSTANKTIAGCHKSRDAGKIPDTTDCNDIAQADSKGKFASGVTKAVTAIQGTCGTASDDVLTANPANIGTQWYVSCPVTTGACAALPNPMTTMNQVATCMGCLAGAIAGDVAEETLGLPAVATVAEEAKCHSAIAKGYGKYFSTKYKSETACQGNADEAGDNDTDGCVNSDPKAKVSGSLTKAGDGLDKACTGANIADLDSCAADTLANLKSCNASAWAASANDAFSSTYQLEGTLCPTAIRTTIRGRCSTLEATAGDCSSGGETDTSLSVGFTGLAHNVDITDGYTLAGDVTCPGTVAGSCGTCTVDGVSTDNPQYTDFARCKSNPSTLCDNLFGPDGDCGTGVCTGGSNDGTSCTANGTCTGGGVCAGIDCVYFLGPPLAVQAGGTPTCTLNAMSTDISGTADPDSGESALLLNLRAVVHTGVSVLQPCPICTGDTTAQDGVKNGTCQDGLNDGDPCDVQGFDLTFAPTNADNPTAGTSLDCPPNIGANISGAGLKIALPLETGSMSKDAVDDCDANPALDCFCGVCSHDTTISCDDDADCSALSMGSVCGTAGGTNRLPNNCTSEGYVCSAVPGQTDRGECAGLTSVNLFCDGALTADGRGIVSCSSDATCQTGACAAPGVDCGLCTLEQQKSCFMDPIITQGTPDTENPILAGTFCLPPTSSPSVNGSSGSPGPGSVKTDTLVEKRY